MTGTIRTCLRVAAVLLAVSPAWADIIKLKDGREYEGKIVEQNDKELKIKTPLGAMTFKREDVVEIVEKKSLVDLMDERLLALNPAEPIKYLEAGKWCVEEAKQEGVGLHLVNLAMALDPRLYGEGQAYLGDYYYGKKNDRRKAARCYQCALLSDPTNPEYTERYEKVKDTVQDTGSASDQKLIDGLRAAMSGNFEQAQDGLESGRNSVMRLRAEEILGGPLQDVIDYCISKTGCKACKGTRVTTCTICKGDGQRDCDTCGGKGYLVRKGVAAEVARLCDGCAGWGTTLCASCKAERVIEPTTSPDGRSTIMSPQLAGTQARSTNRPRYTVKGGTTTCRVCSGRTGRDVPAPDQWKLQEACNSLDRQLRGQLTLWEMSLTRMPRVGGPGQIENARDLLARPVWWNGDFAAIETRRKADPNYGKGGAAGVADAAMARKGARAIAPGAEGPAQFELTIRRTLGLGGAAAAGQKQVYYTDFKPRAAGAGAPAGVPNVEVNDGGRRLNACLVEIAEEFSARRIELDDGMGSGLPLAEALQSGAWGTSGAVVRVFYTVVDSKESVTPGKDRDTVVTRLVVKVTLIDVIDAGGQVLQTTR